MRFSANTGFLWPELSFLDRIRSAAAAGFDAVEFHDEGQGTDPGLLRAVLEETGLPVLGLNVLMGPTSGCAAIPGAEDQARADFDAACRIADRVDAAAIHVLSGKTGAPQARATLIANLHHALERTHRTLLIEPLCRAAMPGYFLHDLDQTAAIVAEVGHPRLKILFDCYHIETEHGDCLMRFRTVTPLVGHVQIAGVPGRHEPGTGGLDYRRILPRMQRHGYAGAFGCEYRPRTTTDAGLGWLAAFRGLLLPGT